MPLTPGTRLGPYEVVAGIGAGGMGEVYRARDTKSKDQDSSSQAIQVVLNWFEELKQRVPTK